MFAPKASIPSAAPPTSSVFKSLASRQLAGKGGRPVSPPPVQAAGAPLPLANGHPSQTYGHAPALMK